MLKCRDIAEQTGQFVDNELPWHKRLSWYMHLGMCAACRRFVKNFRLTIALARQIGRKQQETSDVQVDEIMKKLDQDAS